MAKNGENAAGFSKRFFVCYFCLFSGGDVQHYFIVIFEVGFTPEIYDFLWV
jgi:hypothetical protein